MPSRPTLSSNNVARFVTDLEVAYDYDLVPAAVSVQLGLPPSFMMRSMRISAKTGDNKDAWTWTVGGQTFTRAQIRVAALAVV